MSEPDDFSFSERNKRAKTTVNAPPPEAEPSGTQSEYTAPPPRETPPPPPRDFPPPPRDFPPPPRDYFPPPPEPAPRRKSDDDEEDDFELPIDPWRLVTALKKRWYWLVYSGAAFLLVGALAGYVIAAYKITVTLIQRDVSAPFEAGVGGEVFKPHSLSASTLISLMESSELRQRVSAKSKPFVSGRALGKALSVQPERNTELVHLILTGKNKEELIELANLYANEAVQFTKEVQLEELSRTLKSYQDKAHLANEDMNKVEKEMKAFRDEYKTIDPEAEKSAQGLRIRELSADIEKHRLDIQLIDMELTNKLGFLAIQSPIAKKIEEAEEELRVLKTKYTDAYPSVQNKIQEIANLKIQLNTASTNTTASGGAPSVRDVKLREDRARLEKELAELEKLTKDLLAKGMAVTDSSTRYNLIKGRQDQIERNIKVLEARRLETQFYHDNADGYYRLLAAATWKDLDGRGRWMKLLMLAIGGMIFGMLCAAAVIVAAEAADTRLKTAADVKRVTGLPLLASLGDLNKMTPSDKETWAFRAWTALSGQLSRSANHGLVCGFISSTHSEGRTTWINLLVDAASQRGLRVLTISTRPSPTDLEEMDKAAAEAEKEFSEAVEEAMTSGQTEMPSTAVTITAKALAFPAQVVQKFSGPEALPSAHIALPGWVWNLDRRKQFQRALAHWRSIENMVLLVELPPASVPEAVLLAENLPQLIWLVDSGKPRTRETREQLETLRHAKCRLVGAVLNHEPQSVWKI